MAQTLPTNGVLQSRSNAEEDDNYYIPVYNQRMRTDNFEIYCG